MDVLSIRHNWPERAGFSLNRPKGAENYVLLHFQSVVELTFGGMTTLTRPGAMIIFSPGTPHGFISRGPLLHDWMHLSGPVGDALASVGLAPDTLYQPSCGTDITEMTARLEAEFFARRPHWALHREALLTELFILLSYDLAGTQTPHIPKATADLLRELRSDLLHHPEKNWSNEQMARKVNVSTSRLYPLYRRMFAISPTRDLLLIRTEKARTLLEQGASVADTAEKLGYASVFHFSRQFRQIVGMSPGQYRAQLRATQIQQAGRKTAPPSRIIDTQSE